MHLPRVVVLPLLILTSLAVGCGSTHAAVDARDAQTGTASYVADTLADRPTASGEPYDPDALTAAHRSYPFGTVVRVTNLANDRHVTLRINDRGPFVPGRIIDVSKRAANELGFVRAGLAEVRVEVLTWGE